MQKKTFVLKCLTNFDHYRDAQSRDCFFQMCCWWELQSVLGITSKVIFLKLTTDYICRVRHKCLRQDCLIEHEISMRNLSAQGTLHASFMWDSSLLRELGNGENDKRSFKIYVVGWLTFEHILREWSQT